MPETIALTLGKGRLIEVVPIMPLDCYLPIYYAL